MNGGTSRNWAYVLLGLVACRATPGESEHAVGMTDRWADGETLATTIVGPSAAVPEEVPCFGLGRSLRRVREHFEAGAGRMRLVALLDPRFDGIDAVRRAVQAADEGGVQLVMIWDRDPDNESWRTGLPRDGSVAVFVDRRGVAGRVFARGLLPTVRASEVYLVYGPEARWSEDSAKLTGEEVVPRPLAWWHRMGRLAPGHHVSSALELGERLAGALVSRPGDR